MTLKNDLLFEEFIKGISANALGTEASAEKPFPMTDSLPLWYDLFVLKTDEAFKKINIERYSNNKQALQDLFPTVSNLRFILYKMMRSYVDLPEDRKEFARSSYKHMFNFILEAIKTIVPEDSFCLKSNLLFTQTEVEQKISELELKDIESINQSKLMAKFNLGLTSLVHGVYNDIVTDFGVDVYGPYKVELDGKEYTLLIKHFPYLNPPDLNWPKDFLPDTKEVYLYLLYEGMEWEIKGVGCHTNIISGNPINDLKRYAVIADGKALTKEEIETLTKQLLKKSQDLYISIIDSGFEEQKKQAIFQECFQFQKVFKQAGLDWKPSTEMIGRVKDKQIITTPGIIENIEQYRKFLKLDSFKEETVI